jgi:hypothetical protein
MSIFATLKSVFFSASKVITWIDEWKVRRKEKKRYEAKKASDDYWDKYHPDK